MNTGSRSESLGKGFQTLPETAWLTALVFPSFSSKPNEDFLHGYWWLNTRSHSHWLSFSLALKFLANCCCSSGVYCHREPTGAWFSPNPENGDFIPTHSPPAVRGFPCPDPDLWRWVQVLRESLLQGDYLESLPSQTLPAGLLILSHSLSPAPPAPLPPLPWLPVKRGSSQTSAPCFPQVPTPCDISTSQYQDLA